MAFPTMVAIYSSEATGKVDPSHYTKVGNVEYQLQKLGYVKNENVKDNYFSLLNRKGNQYAIVYDLNNIGYNNQSTYFRAVILPGVSVVTDKDIANMNRFLKNTTDGLLISTEGRLGMSSNNENDLADVFGMTGVATATGNVAANIITNNHPITRNFTNNAEITVAQGAAYKSVTSGQPLAQTKDNVPLMVINKKPKNKAYTLALNFDITTSTNTDFIWQGLSDFAQFNTDIWKVRWQLECNNNVVSLSEAWVTKSSGSVDLPTEVKTACDKPYGYRGYAFNWWEANPSNDNSLGTYVSIKNQSPTVTAAPTSKPGSPSSSSSPDSTNGGDKIIVSSSTSLSISLVCVALAGILYAYL
ncbi:hypothetical protein AKO1_005813 [Acrasis kona]|uniref:Uncharacterized protein n=1 Tax=Acrasis kona TaxID=1008807 RepID=A0AAW2YJT1_9EUKA